LVAASPPEPAFLRRLADPGAYVVAARPRRGPARRRSRASVGVPLALERDHPKHPARGAALDDLAALFGRAPARRRRGPLPRARRARRRAPPRLDPLAVARLARCRPPAGSGEPPAPRARLARGRLRPRGRPGASARRGGRSRRLFARGKPGEGPRVARRPARGHGARGGGRRPPLGLDPLGAAPARGRPAPSGRGEAHGRRGGLCARRGAPLPRWEKSPEELGGDLDVLAGLADYADLRRTLEAIHPAIRTDARAGAEWEQACLGLDPPWLLAHGTVLRRLRGEAYAERRGAFDEVLAQSPAGPPPALLARLARDPAVPPPAPGRARRGESAPVPVLSRRLRDESWIVRQAACAALVTAGATGAVGAPSCGCSSLPTRTRASEGRRRPRSWSWPPRSPCRPRARRRDARRGRCLGGRHRLARRRPLPRGRRPALADALASEAMRPDAEVRRAVLFRLFVAWRRATGRDPGYDPSLSPESVRALVQGLSREPWRRTVPPERSEDAWIRAVASRFPASSRVKAGIGHDAAVVAFDGRDVVLKTDTVVDGVDFVLAAVRAGGRRPEGSVRPRCPTSPRWGLSRGPPWSRWSCAERALCDLRRPRSRARGGRRGDGLRDRRRRHERGRRPARGRRGGRRGASSARRCPPQRGQPGDALSVTGPLGGSILGRHLSFRRAFANRAR